MLDKTSSGLIRHGLHMEKHMMYLGLYTTNSQALYFKGM